MFEIRNTPWCAYCRTAKPSADLTRFIHQCAGGDEVTRSIATAATVLALAQIAGPQMIPHPPGFVLVNAGGALPFDAVDLVTGKLTGLDGVPLKRESESFERSRTSMICQIRLAAHNAAIGKRNPGLEEQQLAAYRQHRGEAFGSGRIGSYTRRYDPELGWITDESRHLPLRLEDDSDRTAFRSDVRMCAERLHRPEGIAWGNTIEPKVLSVAGSIAADGWDAEFTAGVIDKTLPVILLPHMAAKPLAVADRLALRQFAIALEHEATAVCHRPVQTSINLPDDPWTMQAMDRLRRRLLGFPADYDFFIQTTLRRLFEWCHRLAGMAAMDGTSDEEAIKLWLDLHALTLHAISFGIHALGWHGYGFDTGGERAKAANLLTTLREEGDLTKRDLQRKRHGACAGERDAILERLREEGLVRMSDCQVTAVPLPDYLRAIPEKFGLSAPTLRSTVADVDPSVKSFAAGVTALRAKMITREMLAAESNDWS